MKLFSDACTAHRRVINQDYAAHISWLQHRRMSLEKLGEPQVNAQYELMRTLLPAGHVSPQAKWKEATVVFTERRLMCQSQPPLISGSTLTAAEPFSITEH